MSTDDLDDRLAESAIRGDAHALTLLWSRHRSWLTGVVLSCSPDAGEVEDIMQEVGMAVVRDIHTLRDPAAVRPWLRQVARRIAVSAIRQRVREGATRCSVPPAATSVDHARIEALLALVSGLPEHYREPLLLRARGWTPTRIAELLELPVRTVETRLRRARLLVREQSSVHPTREGNLTGLHHDDHANG